MSLEWEGLKDVTRWIHKLEERVKRLEKAQLVDRIEHHTRLKILEAERRAHKLPDPPPGAHYGHVDLGDLAWDSHDGEVYWRGKDVEELGRNELRDAVRDLYRRWMEVKRWGQKP